MQFYLYQHPSTEEVIEIKQKISEAHEYVDGDGTKWNRIFTVPYASIPNMTRIDAGSEEDFMKRTQNFDGTIGDLMDASKDLSEKRKQGTGSDKVQENFHKKYLYILQLYLYALSEYLPVTSNQYNGPKNELFQPYTL